MTAVDVLIVGQGFAGTALAWYLRWRGATVAVVDRADADSASRVAAGLLTPVTGRRLAPTPEFPALRAAAEAFYRRVEAETGEQFFHPAGAVRLFADAPERELYLRKGGTDLDPPVADGFAAPHGGFAMPTAARLAAEPYLAASRRHFGESYRVGEVEPTPDGVRRLGLVARQVVFCVGAGAVPWGPAVRPDAGEVLTLRIDGLTETRVVHRGVWLAPAGDGLYRAGATYARGVTGATPTAAGRAEVLGRLGEFLRRPATVVGHRAGLRPVCAGHRPAVVRHPGRSWLWSFTGLGSKGALTAPTVAAELAAALV
jgi:glycine/D-amino acid oxidase-like deaminating enzyme